MTPDEIKRAIRELQSIITAWSVRKGWMKPGEPRNPLELLMLVNTELSEAAEAFRAGNPPCPRPGMEHFSHAEEELADAVIRIVQMAGEYGFDLGGAIMAKMEFNDTRPERHGGKVY